MTLVRHFQRDRPVRRFFFGDAVYSFAIRSGLLDHPLTSLLSTRLLVVQRAAFVKRIKCEIVDKFSPYGRRSLLWRAAWTCLLRFFRQGQNSSSSVFFG